MTATGYTGGDPSKLDADGYVKGDVIAADATGVLTALTVGTNTEVLTADAVASLGVDWEPSSGSSVTPSGTVVTETTFGQASTAGVVTAYSRGDHTHGTPAAPSIPAAATTVTSETTFGISPGVGTDAIYARQDHTHGSPSAPSIPAAATTVTSETTFGISPAVGVAVPYAREDHTHGSPTAPTIPAAATTVTSETTFGISPAVGSAVIYARQDHTHGSPAAPTVPAAATTVTSETSFGISPAVGSAVIYARQDHTHGSPTAPTAASVGADASGLAAAVAATIVYSPAARFGLEMLTIESGAVNGDFTLTAGTAVFVLVYCTRSVTITTLGAWCTVAGVTTSGANNMAIYSEAGSQLAITGDMTATLGATGWLEGTLTSSLAITVGTRYYLHILTHFSGTAPKLAGGNTTFNHVAINTRRPTVFLTAQATSPASFTPGSATVNTAEYFLGAR
jgi:hypothetical protein